MRTFRLRPSAAASWIKCGASVSLRSLYPDESGEAAELGTAAHWVAWRLLTARDVSVDMIAPNGVVITPEIISGARKYYDHVSSWGIHVHVEEQLDCPDIHEECGGTPDVWGYDWVNNLIRLCDFKYGFRLVDAYENWQLLCYLSGILTKLQAMGIDTSDTRVEFSVCQPRVYRLNGGADPWTFHISAVWGYFATLQEAATVALASTPLATVGPQCEFCITRACVTNQRAGYSAMEISGGPHLLDLTTEQASYELVRLTEARDVLLSRISGLSAQVEASLFAGQPSPLFDLERSRKRTVWVEGSTPDVLTLGKFYGKDLSKPDALVTPTQAIAAGMDPELVKLYSYTPTGENKLVRRDIKMVRNFNFGE